MINTTNLEQAKKQIKQEKSPIMIKAQDPEFNRKVLEYGRFNILLFPESNVVKKDKPKQLDSGLNHVLAEIATKNKVRIGIDLKDLRSMERKEKAIQLARIRQNIKICRKAKTKLALLNIKDKKDAFSLLLTLGASTQQAKEAVA